MSQIKKRCKPLPSIKRLKGMFYLDENLGILINRKTSKCNRVKSGHVAGSKKGMYKIISVDSDQYYAHRIIYFMTTGDQPEEIDHINQDRWDNRPENLRSATSSDNSFNVKLRKDNLAGCKNVSFDKQRGKYLVRVQANGKVKNYGRYGDINQANLVATYYRWINAGIYANHAQGIFACLK